MRKFSLFVLFPLILAMTFAIAAQQATQSIKPNIQQGIKYHPVPDISQYYVSEKLDGVRGYWNGNQLLTRQGNIINSPHWFTSHWPKRRIDGELWIDRNKFQSLISCVSKKNPEENKVISCWRNVRFMMFDLPDHTGDFNQRVITMRSLLTQVPSPYFAMISQDRFNDAVALDTRLNHVISMQGEGLMVHLDSAYYQIGRTTALMKLKKHQDDEALVIGHTEGKGKYYNQLGAIRVKMKNGISFKIGSGFSDYQRANPPAIGTTISFKYNGLTESGVPRFARFWRIRGID